MFLKEQERPISTGAWHIFLICYSDIKTERGIVGYLKENKKMRAGNIVLKKFEIIFPTPTQKILT